MKILTIWLRTLLPQLTVSDAQLGEDLTLRGIAVEGIQDLGAGNGSLFEMDITTNRVDAMNHHGVAREVATIYGLPLPTISVQMPTVRPSGVPFPVSIEADDACGRFTARVLRDVRIAPTGEVRGPMSEFAARMFTLLEQKPISNAVDASNFAWLAMGHPTHTFDLDRITGGIVVRRARKGESLKTLDGVERMLDSEDLIVADAEKPLALAGVMGGWETMITPATTHVLVEAAWFDPIAVRRTARRHGLHTDASHRFERGADFNAAPLASEIVSAMLLENGGSVDGEMIDVRVATLEKRTASREPIMLALSEVHRLLGKTIEPEGISATTIEPVLRGLGCELRRQPSSANSAQWQVTLPSWRLDVEREIDLIEEVARVYGYNRFANTLPSFAGSVKVRSEAEVEAAVSVKLRAAGLHQAIGSTFCSMEEARLFEPQPEMAVALGNPLSAEAGMLRPSLMPSMLAMVAGNLHRDVADVRLFEMGTVFGGSTDRVEERTALALGLAGSDATEGVFAQRRELNFFDLKGMVEQVVECFAARSFYFDQFAPGEKLTPEWLHPWRAARLTVDGMAAGWLGELHPRLAAERKLKKRVLIAEIYLHRVQGVPLRKPKSREISRYQPVRRDFSLLMPRHVNWAALNSALTGLNIAEMTEWCAREVLTAGAGIPGESYALLLGATFQATDRTLREDELQEFAARIVAAVEKLGGRLRAESGNGLQ